jgi:hypothetical protein
MRNVLDKGYREDLNTHCMFNNIFPKIMPFNRQCRKIWWSQRATNDVTLWRIPVACWLNKTTCTHSHEHTHAHTHKYVLLIAFPQQLWFRQPASVLRCTYIACLGVTQTASKCEHTVYRHTELTHSSTDDVIINTTRNTDFWF